MNDDFGRPGPMPPADTRNKPEFPPPAGRGGVLYPRSYTWYVFLASLDVLLTAIILHPLFGGIEVNLLARLVLRIGGLPGAVALKFGVVVLVVCVCEFVGRRDERLGRKLAEWSVALTAIPVVVAFVQLLVDAYVISAN